MADPVEPARRAGDAGQQPVRRRVAVAPGVAERMVRTRYDGPHYSHDALDALMRERPAPGHADSD